MCENFDDVVGGIRVNVVVRGIALADAKNLIEKHFGSLPWPAARGGKTRVDLAKGVTIEIKVPEV